MKIIVGIPALGQNETLQKNVDRLIQNAKEKVTIVVFDNGSPDPIPLSNKYYSIRSEVNIGVPKAMNQIMDVFKKADYYMMVHSDFEMYEKDWDVKLKKIIQDLENYGEVPGVLGGFGSRQLGSNDINDTPYNKFQLGRAHNWAGNKIRLSREHGFNETDRDFMKCITLDGYWLTVKKGLRFWENVPHHFYDHDICMESIDKGYSNWTVNLEHNHEGGVTVCREDWTKDLDNTGDEIHDIASLEFYNKWKHKLPMICIN